jgi:secreted trypsin-like serine protease
MIKKNLFSIFNIFFITLAFNLSSVWGLDSLVSDNTVPLKAETFDPSEAVLMTPRIIGGVEADEYDWPWMAALVYAGVDAYNGQFCGGTLIDEQWVVTAAHCTDGFNPEDIEVILGVHNLSNDEGQRFTVRKIIEHENYDPKTNDSDIALLHLSKPSLQKSIELVEQGDPEGLTAPFTSATVIGWGTTDPFGYRYPVELRQVNVPILPGLFGLRIYGPQTFSINMLVAGFLKGGKDSCSGDSGGPLMVRDTSGTDWVLAGITSWGIGCARPKFPGVYTRASRFTSWVELKMENAKLKLEKEEKGIADVW